MDERGGVERVSVGLATELAPRQAPQLLVDERQRPVERRAVTRAGENQKVGDALLRAHARPWLVSLPLCA